jgi:hypothetical protein
MIILIGTILWLLFCIFVCRFMAVSKDIEKNVNDNKTETS